VSRAAPATAVAAFVAAVVLVPLALDDFQASQFAYVAIYAIAIAGLNILTGYSGQISLGHGAFMALGGYTTAILAARHDVSYGWTIPLAGLVAGAAGSLAWIPLLRIGGLYVALVTFGLAVAMPALLRTFGGLTGGSAGLGFDLLRGPSWIGLSANDWLYYLCWATALVLVAAAAALLHGRLGRTFRAVRDSEIAASSFGVNLALYRTLAFALSALYAGVAGSLFAIANLSYVSPDTFRPQLSVLLVAGAVVAGLGSLWGVVAGAAVLEFLQLHTPDIVDAINWLFQLDLDPKAAGVSDAIFGGVLVAVVLAAPGGAASALRKLGLEGRGVHSRR
jgi:branched-chain amino acid transport system permease protein